MTSERDVYRAAAAMVAMHGDRAPTMAGARADELRDVGDVSGHAVLQRVRRATEILLQRHPTFGELVH